MRLYICAFLLVFIGMVIGFLIAYFCFTASQIDEEKK